jgi:hypothetical protein
MLFDAHPSVIIPPEFPILPLIANKFRHVTRWDEPMLESFLSTIWENATFGHRTLGQLGVDREALAMDLKRLQGEVSLGNLLTEFNAHTRSFFPKSEILMAGDTMLLFKLLKAGIYFPYPVRRMDGLPAQGTCNSVSDNTEKPAHPLR